MLCSKCQCIDFSASALLVEINRDVDRWKGLPESLQPTHIGNHYYVSSHHSRIEELYHFASKGCHFCIQIRSELCHHRGHEFKDKEHDGPLEIRYYPHAEKLTGETTTREIVVVVSTAIRIVKMSFDFVRFPVLLTSISHAKAQEAAPSTGCNENMKLASLWLNRCLAQHCFCTLSTTTLSPLPTRVLDVDAPHSPSRLSLVINTKVRYGHYVTLSHVWGKRRIITTTTSNIVEHERCIPFNVLSQTFKNAVAVVRSLNIRYLWIDSMCILQDDPRDWSCEAAKMGSYYLNSLFTIAAVSAHGGHAGCFTTYEPLTIIPCPLRIKFPSDETIPGSVVESRAGFVRPTSDWDPVGTTDGFHRPILWQRAWVLQERLLSPRLLLFSEMKVSWLCRTEEASERVPEGTSKFIDIGHGHKILQSAILGLNTSSTDEFSSTITKDLIRVDSFAQGRTQEHTDLYDAWYDTIMLYGKCGLTVESDIFPAIAGLARGIGKSTGDEYYAGHWKRDLHRGLLWTAPDSTLKRHDLRNYRAPSWSWASLPATCTFFVRQILQSEMRTSLQVIMVEIKSDPADPFGAVYEGKLIVQSALKKAHPSVTDLEVEERMFSEMRTSNPHSSLFDLDAKIALGHYYPDNEDRKLFSEVWCAPITTEASYRTRRAPDGGEIPLREARCWAMICLDFQQQVYMRVGLAWVQDAEWFEHCPKITFTII